MNNLFKSALLSLLMVTSAASMAATPRGYDLSPSSSKLFVATAGEVVLTFLSKTAAYSSDLYLQGTGEQILNNQSAIAGTQYSLGNFEAGTKLDFTMFVKTTGLAYYTGGANLNPDGILHAAYDITSKQSLNVGFEDLLGGGDKDYDDLVFSLTNVYAGEATPVPEPETNAMLLIGSLMLGVATIKRKKS